VLEAAGVAGVSDADPARYMCVVDDSKDWTEESAKGTNPLSAVAQLITERAERRLWAFEEEQAEKRLKANSKKLSDDELNSKLKRLRGSALNTPAIFKFDPSDQAKAAHRVRVQIGVRF
jgi:hypothetical protein